MTHGLTTPIEDALEEIARDGVRARLAIAACQVRFAESAPLLRAVLARAAAGEIQSEPDANLAFVGLHILGAGRDKKSWPDFVRLLRLPEERLEWFLGDAITETLHRIAAGLFDGDAPSLFEMIADGAIDEFVKGGLFGALAFLAWKDDIGRDAATGFLERFDEERLAGECDSEYLWSVWAETGSLLGVPGFPARIDAARSDGRIDWTLDDREGWSAMAAEAEARYDDGSRFEKAGLGYIEDTLVALERFGGDADEEDELGDAWPYTDDFAAVAEPVINEWRDVGRNDPCPCGSGKKAKKCCLAPNG